MGISGLLPLLKNITRNVHISQYANQRVAIDAYCWLHRGAYSCSTELCQNIPTVKYINFCVSRVQLLRSFNITPVLVFDGGALPSKKGQEEKRRKKRREERAKAAEYLQQGNRTAANDCYRKAVDITPRMAHKLIKALQAEGIECIVAPYEADAQLAFLSHTGYVHSVISEDSDLLPFGCKRVLFKMDGDGNGKEIQLSDLGQNTPLRFHNFTHDMFRQMCILSGCDYLASITGLGVKKAHGLLNKYRTMDRVFRFLKNDRSFIVPPEYEEAFERAERTFLHQSVYDHINQRVIPLTPYPDGMDSSAFPFCGALIPDDLARLIASGQVDPYSYEPFEEDTAPKPAPMPAPSATHHESDSGAHLGTSHEPCDEDALTMRASRSRTSLCASSGSSGRNVVGRMPSFGGGRSKMPLLLPQRNSISSYFTPSSRRTQRPFVPPRGSQSQSQSSLDETSAEDEVVIELKSQGEEEALEDQPAEERLPPQAERDRRVPPRPHAARAEAMMHVETEKRLREEDDDEQGWELVKKSTSSYEVLVARTPSPHSRSFKVAPRPLLGEESSPSRRRLLFEDQVQVVVTSKYFSTTTTTTTTTSTSTSISAAAAAPASPTSTSMPTPTARRHSPAGSAAAVAASPRPASAFDWLDRPLLLDPTAQSVEESDEEDEAAWTGEAAAVPMTGEENRSGALAALHSSVRVTPPEARGKQQRSPPEPSLSSSSSSSSLSPSSPSSAPTSPLPSSLFSSSRKRRREDEEEETNNRLRHAQAAPLKKERTSSLMAKVDEFLRSDAFDDSQREDEDNDEEEDRRPSPPPKVEEAIDLTFEELPEFQSPMISSGKRLSTPLGFLSRAKQQKAQRQTPSPGTPTVAKTGGNSVGTLFSYFNKHGFNRQSLSGTPSSSRSPSPSSTTSTTLADQPKLEEDGVEIVGFVPRTPASTRPPPQSSRPPQQGGGGLTSPYFASSTSSGNKS